MFYVKTSEKPGKIRQVLPPQCSKNKAKVTKKEDEVLLGQPGAELKGSRKQGWSRAVFMEPTQLPEQPTHGPFTRCQRLSHPLLHLLLQVHYIVIIF